MRKLICTYFLLTISLFSFGQQILLDQPVKAGELTLFPDLANPNNYFFLSDKPHLATDANGRPQFSFLRYAQNNAAGGTEIDGGGIVHAVIELSVSPEQLNRARQELRRVNPNGVIQGPVVYRSGTIALVSSIARANGDFAKQVIGVGKAPILDGQKAAISVQLNKLGAKILWESFKTPTPDMSISFEMEVAGYRSPKRATIEANFEQVYQNQTFQAAIASTSQIVLAAEINQAYEDLRKSGAIKVTYVGEDAGLQTAIQTAYDKLISMMFDPINGSGTPNLSQLAGTGGTPSVLDRATTLLNAARQEARTENQGVRNDNRQIIEANNRRANNGGGNGSARRDTSSGRHPSFFAGGAPRRELPDHLATVSPDDPPTPGQNIPLRQEVAVPSTAIVASYSMRTVRQRGTFFIDLNKYTADNLSMRFDGNFGEIKCTECFREVNLDDPLYRQREISISLDGLNFEDFGKYVNTVNVLIRKKHGTDTDYSTSEEVNITRTNFNAEGNNFKRVYGWKNDTDRLKWYGYEYKTDWVFFGGYKVENPWVKTSQGNLILTPPLIRRVVTIDADPDILKQANVRSIEVKIYNKIGDQEQVREARLNPKTNEISKNIDIIQPMNMLEYEYSITWIMADGSTKKLDRKKTDNTFIIADNLPK